MRTAQEHPTETIVHPKFQGHRLGWRKLAWVLDYLYSFKADGEWWHMVTLAAHGKGTAPAIGSVLSVLARKVKVIG